MADVRTVDPRHTAAWAGVAFVGIFLFQRLTIPGLLVPVTLPLLLIWAMAALYTGVLELDRRRTIVWLATAGVTSMMMVIQPMLVTFPLISANSWLLWMVTWLPMAFRFTDRSRPTFEAAMHAISTAAVGLATLSIAFIGIQVVGVRYQDLLAELVPSGFLVEDFVITYPIAWNSPIYKSNAWFALEPSFLSFMLGVALVCALISRRSIAVVSIIAVGLLCTTAGSGIAVVAVYVVVEIVRGRSLALLRFWPAAAVLLVAGIVTGIGELIVDRVDEAGSARSSTTLRAIEPYLHLAPQWASDPGKVLVGGGPGASQRVVQDLGITGLLVPTPAKMLYDYGVVGGLLMLALIVICYVRSPSSGLAIAQASSLLILQGASQPLVALSLLTVTAFAPRLTVRESLPPFRPIPSSVIGSKS